MKTLILLVILIPSLLCFLMVLLACAINYSVHKEMLRGERGEIGRGNFNDFLREYNKREWERDSEHRKSHFGKRGCSSSNYVHASIIRFGGVNMELDL